jgi:hypothetical protein
MSGSPGVSIPGHPAEAGEQVITAAKAYYSGTPIRIGPTVIQRAGQGVVNIKSRHHIGKVPSRPRRRSRRYGRDQKEERPVNGQ